MIATQPEVHLRIGSHAEKEYIEKMIKRFDGLTVGANLVEATPGATASLVVKLCSEAKGVPYLIDPMTYAFGSYIDPVSGQSRTDLDWIKSDQKVKGQTGKSVRKVKSSYEKLANALGTVFLSAFSQGRAIEPNDLREFSIRNQVCESVLEYQLNRIRNVFSSDPDYKDFADKVPVPMALWAPYFYIEPSKETEWIDVNLKLASESASIGKSRPVYAVLCAPQGRLVDDSFLNKIAEGLPKTGITGVWLWFSQFDERFAKKEELGNFRKLVSKLSATMKVYNLHGGYFSLGLSLHGLAGIGHGVGYGEQKDVVPVIGQSTPTVRYYLPPLYARFGVPDIERCFSSVGVKTPADFFAKICDCVICRGVIGSSLSNFREFGERHLSTPLSKRPAQTPAAAKRCRFHFLLNRLRERDWIAGKTDAEILKLLRSNAAQWRSTVLREQANQIERWADALS
jgi:hypothetical protein